MSFVAGVASFVLVDRQMVLATPILVLLLLSWIVFEYETLLFKQVERLTSMKIPPVLVAFAAQGLHQETLFFVLPFVLVHTIWLSLHAVFTVLVVLLAAISVLDVFYYPMVQRSWSRTLLHAFVTFLVVFVSLPQLVHLTTTASLKIACGVMALLSLPTIYRRLQIAQPWRPIATIALAALLGISLWLVRPIIPPTNLRVTKMFASSQLDRETREAKQHDLTFSLAEARQGIWVFSAIKAPKGLKEEIYHSWYWQGELVDRVKLLIQGGREEGFRSWSKKDHFPKQPYGTWRVVAVTLSGQHIGSCWFVIEKDGTSAEPEPSQPINEDTEAQSGSAEASANPAPAKPQDESGQAESGSAEASANPAPAKPQDESGQAESGSAEASANPAPAKPQDESGQAETGSGDGSSGSETSETSETSEPQNESGEAGSGSSEDASASEAAQPQIQEHDMDPNAPSL